MQVYRTYHGVGLIGENHMNNPRRDNHFENYNYSVPKRMVRTIPEGKSSDYILYSHFWDEMGRKNNYGVDLPYNPYRLPSLFLMYTGQHERFRNTDKSVFRFHIQTPMEWGMFVDDVRDIFDYLPDFKYLVKMNFFYELLNNQILN